MHLSENTLTSYFDCQKTCQRLGIRFLFSMNDKKCVQSYRGNCSTPMSVQNTVAQDLLKHRISHRIPFPLFDVTLIWNLS
ncbi:hypothetical protein EUGRSUZ_K03332 [Eucalyptus grandis]|uniref:Uncharacterized protein n=2 Tax=Eucalyptus grandis TaxID=71139 RepID=A0ACC3IZE3_EUCGR|nr:hypothetical protein EUGRSUZ_K03332 [Eucalyptus grandis]